MAVAFDVATFDAITGDDSIVHTPSGTPRAVVVLIVQSGSAADLIAAVTYGGEDVPQVVRASDALGELGSAYGFFLGAGIPTGEQTVAIDVSSGTEAKAVWVLTFTAAGDCELVATNVVEGDADDPSTILATLAGFSGMVAAALFSGLGLPSNSDAGAGYTPLAAGADPDGHDFGVNTANAMYGAKSGADVVADWTTSSADDVALAALAFQEAAGQEVPVAQATETDVAQAVGRAKARAAAQATETETAQPIGRHKTVPVGQAVDTEVAQPVAAAAGDTVPVGQASETSSAQPAGRAKTRTAEQALESDVAQPAGRAKSRAVGVASEISIAHALARAKSRLAAIAVESSVAQALARLKRRLLGQALETDVAQPVGVGGIQVPAAVALADRPHAQLELATRAHAELALEERAHAELELSDRTP